MEDTPTNALAVALFSEILTNDQLIRNQLSRVLPKGMEISHFSVLNHLARAGAERSPAELARSFHVTRGAMTNTLHKLEWAGYVHIRPDWDDARRKRVSISPAGRTAREAAISSITPLISEVVSELGEDKVRSALPVLRSLRARLGSDE
ncbi:MarR family transcriptional regulator [Pelagivirga sediminicola]|uniref:MarR family transcriptional regulator n=1 Tax=Pelagivirga sediminicola TaxID=2170575 RepID=A0A2T7G8J6_9RHOB|nr:MarR family transcriptional regulator [Pelagivirga sediminicola]PVA10740.1 MarR family transcriptional regulator [Pelagivirga sediminicola]